MFRASMEAIMAGNKPAYIAYAVREIPEGSDAETGPWREIGAAWKARGRDGREYLNVTLDAIPAAGFRLVLATPKERDSSTGRDR